MVSNKIERKIEDVILGLAPIPYADREIIEIAEGFIGADLPGLPHIELSEMSTGQKVLLAIFAALPLLDVEYLDLIGMDPFKNAEATQTGDEDRNELDDFEADKTAPSNRSGRAMRDRGRRQDERVYNPAQAGGGSGNDISGKAGTVLPKVFHVFFNKYTVIGLFAIIGLIVFVGVFGGGGHAMLLNEMFGGYTSGLDSTFGEVGYSMNKAVNAAICLGNSGCIREWQMNNTREPGSEDVGETYELKVNGPEIRGSNDVRYMEPESRIPIGFTLENTRHGLKGIDARNVQYRLMVRQPSVFTAGKGQCKTDWLPLNKYDVSDEAKSNTILPGEIAQPLNYDGERRLSIKECGLLNPVNANVEAILQVKYDYSAMAFLNLEAMSSENFQGTPTTKNSKTPDTPVESYISSPNPVMYNEDNAIPFQMNLGVHTDERNIEFRSYPDQFELKASDLVENTESCDGLQKKSQDRFKLSDKISERINQRIEDDAGWFSKKVKFPKPSCSFKLENPEEISETGETLTFTANVNYTVRQEESSTTFNMRNTLCRDLNCPQIQALKPSDLDDLMEIDLGEDSPVEEIDNEDYWKKEYALCNSPHDAQPGCGVVKSWSYGDRQDPIEQEDGKDLTIGSGRFALNVNRELKGKGNNFLSCYLQKNDKWDSEIVGISKTDLNDIYHDGNYVLNQTSMGDWVKTRVQDGYNCKKDSGG